MIRLKKDLKLTTLQKVKIKDDDWNRPGGGYLDSGSVVIVTSGPTKISDVPFKVLSGSGEIVHRNPIGGTLKQIAPGPGRFFFSQGHETKSPYDFGTLDAKLFKVCND
jgi:hypothetical protein